MRLVSQDLNPGLSDAPSSSCTFQGGTEVGLSHVEESAIGSGSFGASTLWAASWHSALGGTITCKFLLQLTLNGLCQRL